jgi:Fe2+ transport system protein FeoA
MERQKLNTIAAGRKGVVVALLGGRHFQERLVSMGINVGCEIEVLHSSHHHNGPTLIVTGETRLAIGQGMAEKILVAVDAPAPRTKSRLSRRLRRRWFRPLCRRM